MKQEVIQEFVEESRKTLERTGDNKCYVPSYMLRVLLVAGGTVLSDRSVEPEVGGQTYSAVVKYDGVMFVYSSMKPFTFRPIPIA